MSKTRNSKSDLGSLSKKIQTHEKVKVSEIAGWISKCCNNRVKCKQGSEQWWARKEKSQTKYWFGLLQKTT